MYRTVTNILFFIVTGKTGNSTMATNNNRKMNDLIRTNAPETASNPEGPAADSAGNQWFRSSVRDSQQQRFNRVWGRLMDAHERELEWEERLKGGTDGQTR